MSQIQAVTHRKVLLTPESAIRDCLTCSDTEEAAINSTCKWFWKKVQASCNIVKVCLWSEAQMKWIGDSCHAVWRVTMKSSRQQLTLEEDCNSFEVNKMMVRTDQLLQIKEVTHLKIHPCESKAGVQGRKKTLVQSLKEFHAHFYWLYKKAMVSLQGLHLGNAFRLPNCFCQHGVEVILPLVSSARWKCQNNCHPPPGGTL